MNVEVAVRVRRLVVALGGETVLDLPRLDVEAAAIHVLVGPNGAGKTTLLRAMAGLLRPATGRVEVFGRALCDLPHAQRLALMRCMTLCPERPYLFGTTVRRNIAYGLRFRKLDAGERARRVRAAMEALDLVALADRDAQALSGGEARRVSLARALALRPALVLLDEPLVHVDRANVSRVERAIVDLRAQGGTVVIATHRVELARRMSARLIRIEAGRLAPLAVDNALQGTLVDGEGRLARLIVEGAPGSCRVHLRTDRRGPARVAVDPEQITVTTAPAGAPNIAAGEIVALARLPGAEAISLRVHLGGGVELRAQVDPLAFEGLGVTLGDRVCLGFDAQAVHLC